MCCQFHFRQLSNLSQSPQFQDNSGWSDEFTVDGLTKNTGSGAAMFERLLAAIYGHADGEDDEEDFKSDYGMDSVCSLQNIGQNCENSEESEWRNMRNAVLYLQGGVGELSLRSQETGGQLTFETSPAQQCFHAHNQQYSQQLYQQIFGTDSGSHAPAV